ncbi:hypothetical protein AVEN_114693-1 [Araneus ventricosus]|uniref:Uncharacterized protein n=1 Tax=Araneus ventricosus TaxID=182803 RepID=A0A4Y2MPZ6_ARAVE|nr:hypothetical protein AVEN_114693-1 [Araneus ventricosus]
MHVSYRETIFYLPVSKKSAAREYVTAKCTSEVFPHDESWGNSTLPGTISGAETYGSLWVQDRDYRRNGQTPSSSLGTIAAVVVYAAPNEGGRCRRATQCQSDAPHASPF